jgi:hypothetical protein
MMTEQSSFLKGKVTDTVSEDYAKKNIQKLLKEKV